MRKRIFSKLAIVMSAAIAVSGCFCPTNKAFVNAESVQTDESTNDVADDATEQTGTKIEDIKVSSSELKEFVKSSDLDKDGYISQTEADSWTYLTVSKKASQSDLTQILKVYTNITWLTWNAGTLTKLTFPKNNITNLSVITKSASQMVISGIDQKLNSMSYTAIGSKKYAFNFKKCSVYSNVNYFYLSGKQINGIKLSNESIGTLYLTDTATKKINVSGAKLSDLWAYNNKKITSFTMKNCPNLTAASCVNGSLSKLNISGCNKLEYITCDKNKLTKLDLSKYTKLKRISCGQNKIKKLDISKNKNMVSVYCSDNKLTKMNTSNNKQLVYFHCANNKLRKIDVTSNTKLGYLSCYGNKFTKVNLKKNKELTSMGICKTYKLLSSYIPTASKSSQNYMYVSIKKGSKLNLLKYAPALKKAKFSNEKYESKNVTISKKGVISVKKKDGYVDGIVMATLNNKDYRIRVTGY